MPDNALRGLLERKQTTRVQPFGCGWDSVSISHVTACAGSANECPHRIDHDLQEGEQLCNINAFLGFS